MEKSIQIGKTAHAAHLAYCKENEIPTQPKWDELTTEHRNVILNSVKKIYEGEIRSPKDSHENFVKMKKSHGWKYGEVYSIEDKTNPRLVNFEKLDVINRTKEALFFAIVQSFRSSVSTIKYQ